MKAIDRRYLRAALTRAIEWDASLIDSYRVQWSKRSGKNGMPRKVIPKDFKAQASECRRNIAHFKRLLETLRVTSTRSKTTSV